jgi:CheY-like chemotaxis protein
MSKPCEGINALIVEDEALVSMLIEDMLTDLGCSEIAYAANVADALKRIDASRPDVAILDVNLGGKPVFPVAQKLSELGVPFMFTTGYGASGVPAEWSDRPVVQKPFVVEVLTEVLLRIKPQPQA